VKLALPPLPYAFDALEPHISRRTVATHYGQHHAAYVDKARSLIEGTPLESAALDLIVLSSAQRADGTLFNAAAQAWNHSFYWRSMRPGGGGEAHGPIAQLIEDGFSSYTAFCQAFTTTAVNQFGSGWAWLVLDDAKLRITATSNAGTPLVQSQVALLAIDVWEHAYYLDYQQRRADYIAAFLTHLVDWDFANRNLRLAPGARAQAPLEQRLTAVEDQGDAR
jgi:Fe-Mn family superoxide dismutase